MIYIVTYDLIEPGQKYDDLLNLIKSEPAWARLGGSAYLVDSKEEAVALRDKYKRALDNNDKLYVGIVKAPAAWVGMPEEVSKWIKDHLEEN